MSKRLKYIIGSIVLIVLLIIGANQFMYYQTKKYSPERVAEYNSSNLRMHVTYSSPAKKGRVIFGNLVPYGKWWRTGANEPTQLTVSNDIVFDENKLLTAGKYSIITIPGAEEWTVIFNSYLADWGTRYKPEYDVVRVQAPVEPLLEELENFTIDFSEIDGKPKLILAWDRTKVSVPFSVK